MGKLKRIPIEHESGFCPGQKGIPPIKQKHYEILDIIAGGDAPKEVIRAYEYKQGRVSNKKNWDIYIAKTGHKWYPNESITEYLLNQLGECFGLKMALSKLAFINGQIRFLSKYFLKDGKNQLIHGAEIFANFLGDKDFVEEIEEQQQARLLFTVQFVRDALQYTFPEHWKSLFRDFIKMIVFDAIVGNNDRHFYNWGVINSVEQSMNPPVFSPIYDTARGLFWNESEEKVVSLLTYQTKLNKYILLSRPKIGWDGEGDLNHFRLVHKIAKNEFGITYGEIKSMLSVNSKEKCLNSLKSLSHLFSQNRLELISSCLEMRFEKLKEEIS